MSSNYIDDCFVPGQSRAGMNVRLNPVHKNQQSEFTSRDKVATQSGKSKS